MDNIIRTELKNKLQQQREIQTAAAQQRRLLQLQRIPNQKQQLIEQLHIENRILRLGEAYQFPSSSSSTATAELTSQGNNNTGIKNNRMPLSSEQQEQQEQQRKQTEQVEQIEHLRKQNRIALERQLQQSREIHSLKLLRLQQQQHHQQQHQQQQQQLNALLSQSLMPTGAVAAASMPFVPSYSPRHHHHVLGSSSNMQVHDAASMPSNFLLNNNFPMTAGLPVNRVFLSTTNNTPPIQQQHGRQAARRGNSHTSPKIWINKGSDEELHHKLEKGASSTMVSTTTAAMKKKAKACDHRDLATQASAAAAIDGTRASTSGTLTPQKRKHEEQDSTKRMLINKDYDTKYHREEGEELPSSLLTPEDQGQIAASTTTTNAVAVAPLVNSDGNSKLKNKEERHKELKQHGTGNTSDRDLKVKASMDQRFASAPMFATHEQFAQELLLLGRSSKKSNLKNKEERHQELEQQGKGNTSDRDKKAESNMDQRLASAPMVATHEQFAEELLLLGRSSKKSNLKNKEERHQDLEQQGTGNTSDRDLKAESNMDQRLASAPMVATHEQFAQELLLLGRSSSKPPCQQNKKNLRKSEAISATIPTTNTKTAPPSNNESPSASVTTKPASPSATIATLIAEKYKLAPVISTSNSFTGHHPHARHLHDPRWAALFGSVKQYATNARSSIIDHQQQENQNPTLVRDNRKKTQSTAKSLSASLPPSSDTKFLLRTQLSSSQDAQQRTGDHTEPLLISQLKDESQLKNQSLPCRLVGRNYTNAEKCHCKPPSPLSSPREDRIVAKKSAMASYSTKQQHQKHDEDEGVTVDRSSETQKEDFESIHAFSPSRWNVMFDKLKQYKEEYGDCLVPVDNKAIMSQARTEEENKAQMKKEPALSQLGQWTVLQRQNKHLLCKDRLQRLRDIGFIWKNSKTLKPDEAWNAMFQRLLNYKQIHGDLLVPRTYKGDKQLAGWVVRQRERKQKLPQHRKKRLEDIGFPWNGSKEHRENWNVMFDRLVQYKEEHGHCNVPRFHEDDKLGRWVPRQRINKEAMSSVRRKRLEDISFSWSIKKEQNIKVWNRMFNRLLKYKEDHGDLLVPEDYKDDSSLGRWVYLQRAKKNSLPPDRKQRLDEIQFVWEDYGPRRNQKSRQADESWNEMFERLCDYKGANGHTRALRREGADPKLGYWAACQRARRHNLSDSRSQKLDSIGFVWSVNATDDTAASAPTDT